MNIADDKRLKALLKDYKVANSARCRAYGKRSRLTNGVWDSKQMKRIQPDVTPELLAQVEEEIQVARKFKLLMSKRLREYCKTKKYHIQWGDSNQIVGVFTHEGWQLRRGEGHKLAQNMLAMLYKLKLTKKEYSVYGRRW